MDPETQVADEPREKSVFRSVVIAALVAFVIGVLLGRFLWPTGDDLEIVQGKLGVVSNDLDAVALQGSTDSYDLSHASNVECLDGLERESNVTLGIATLTTGDEDTPDVAYLNSPEAEVVLWVECGARTLPADGET